MQQGNIIYEDKAESEDSTRSPKGKKTSIEDLNKLDMSIKRRYMAWFTFVFALAGFMIGYS